MHALLAVIAVASVAAVSCRQYRSQDFMSGCIGECGERFEAQRTVSSFDPQTSCGASRCSVLIRITGELCSDTSMRLELASNGSRVFTKEYNLDGNLNAPVHNELIYSQARIGDRLKITARPVPGQDNVACKRLGNLHFELDLYRI